MSISDNTALQVARPPQLPLGSLEAYIQRVNEVPLLTLEEERALAARLQEQGDLQAAQKLVLSHIRYVVPYFSRVFGLWSSLGQPYSGEEPWAL